MSWTPISGTVPQYHVSGSPASGYFLKFYQSGTTTAVNMATDSGGGTTLAKCQINAAGFPINGSSAVFIPHVAQPKYKLALYLNAADADADTTGSAAWIVDALTLDEVPNVSTYDLATTAAATSHAGISTGHKIVTSYHDTNRAACSGGEFSFTGTTTVGKAGNWPDTDSYFYDGLGQQFSVLGPVNVQQFGALGDGATADEAAFKAAALVGGSIHMPKGTYNIEDEIVFALPITLWGDGAKTIIKHNLGAAGGDVFKFTTDDVYLHDFAVDGTDHVATLTGANTRVIFLGDGATTYYNHSVERVYISDCAAYDGLTHTGGNILVTHAFYVDNLENMSIRDCEVSDVSGAAVFARDIVGGAVDGNRFEDSGWYTIHLVGGCINFSIKDNQIDNSGRTDGIFYGGGIDLMSQHSPLETRNEHVRIVNNDLSGFYAYGAAIRIQSAENIRVVGNWIHDWEVGSDPSGANEVTAIRVGTRGTGVGAENGPCQHIVIKDNVMEAPTGTGNNRGIYCDNFYQNTATIFKNLIITGNEIESVNTTNRYFSSCIAVHGGTLTTGGIENVVVRDNFCQGVALTGQVADGLIGLVAGGATSYIKRVYIGSNFVRELGTPASAWQVGIGIGAYVQQVYNSAPNFIQNCFVGLRTFTNSLSLDQSLAQQNWLGNTTDLTLDVDLTAGAEETATGTYTLSSEGITLIDSSAGAVTGTLGSGYYRGQEKLIVMTDSSNSSTVSITNHATSDPEVVTFAAVDDTIKVQWTGTEWITVVRVGATV